MLEVENLTVSFSGRDGRAVAVDGISFSVAAGETFVIIGESGSGKSLTGMAIAGLAPEGARAARSGSTGRTWSGCRTHGCGGCAGGRSASSTRTRLAR